MAILLMLFVLYITMRGEFDNYRALMTGTAPDPTSTP